MCVWAVEGLGTVPYALIDESDSLQAQSPYSSNQDWRRRSASESADGSGATRWLVVPPARGGGRSETAGVGAARELSGRGHQKRSALKEASTDSLRRSVWPAAGLAGRSASTESLKHESDRRHGGAREVDFGTLYPDDLAGKAESWSVFTLMTESSAAARQPNIPERQLVEW